MKKDDGNRSSKVLRVSCHTKFRFAESGTQCILGECGPLNYIVNSFFIVIIKFGFKIFVNIFGYKVKKKNSCLNFVWIDVTPKRKHSATRKPTKQTHTSQ